MKKLVFLMGLLSASPAWSIDLNRADIIGKVAEITLASRDNGQSDLVRIYFSSTIKDRWGCVTGENAPGYIEITNASTYVSDHMLQMIYSQALTAQTTGKTFGSGGPPDCKMNNFGVLFNEE